MSRKLPPVGTFVRQFLDVYVPKTITVRVPNGATGYDDAWKEAFANEGVDITVEGIEYTPQEQ